MNREIVKLPAGGKDDADMPQPDAFRELYERYAELVYSIALSFLHVPADAEEKM